MTAVYGHPNYVPGKTGGRCRDCGQIYAYARAGQEGARCRSCWKALGLPVREGNLPAKNPPKACVDCKADGVFRFGHIRRGYPSDLRRCAAHWAPYPTRVQRGRKRSATYIAIGEAVWRQYPDRRLPQGALSALAREHGIDRRALWRVLREVYGFGSAIEPDQQEEKEQTVGRPKLTPAKAKQIREQVAAGSARKAAAAAFGVSESAVDQIVAGERWKDAGGPIFPRGQKARPASSLVPLAEPLAQFVPGAPVVTRPTRSLAELTRLSEDLGLYDLPELDNPVSRHDEDNLNPFALAAAEAAADRLNTRQRRILYAHLAVAAAALAGLAFVVTLLRRSR